MNYASKQTTPSPDGDSLAPIQTVSMHVAVADRLRQLIYEHLQPGDWMDELALARQLGVSRTPLREALKVLASEGLVTQVPRRGSFVASLSADEAEELFPVMALLEGRCAYEAVKKASDRDVAGLLALHRRLEQHAAAGRVAEYYAANQEFHQSLEALAGNRWLQRISHDLRRMLRLLRGRQLQLPGRLEESLGEHRELIEAIEARDAKRAQRIMHDHLLAQGAAWRTIQKLNQQPVSTSAKPAR
jgi:DNA-binding GntR family transcriptional regulator